MFNLDIYVGVCVFHVKTILYHFMVNYRVDPSERREILTEESNDSSTIDPETEGK